MAILAEGPNNLKGIDYFHPFFSYHDHSLAKPNICAKLKRNRWLELYGFAGLSFS